MTTSSAGQGGPARRPLRSARAARCPFGSWSAGSQRHAATMASTRTRHSTDKHLEKPDGGEPVVQNVCSGEPEHDGAEPSDVWSQGAGTLNQAVAEPGGGDGTGGQYHAHAEAEQQELSHGAAEPVQLERGADDAEEHWQGAAE